MARELWTVDGWPLNQTSNGVPIRDIELNEGLYGPPAQVGANGTISNFTGELWRPKKHGPGRFVLNMFLAPEPDDPAFTRVRLDAAFDELYRAFQHSGRLMTFQRTLQSGEVRVCQGETVSVSPSPIGKGNNWYRFGIEVNVPAGYWQSLYTFVSRSGASSFTERTLNLSEFVGATAPLEDLQVVITGGVENPLVQDTTDDDLGVDGDWFSYYGTIPVDGALVVNCSDWTVAGIGGDSVGGFDPSVGQLSHKGGRFLTVEHPRPGRVSQVTMTAVNVTPECNLQLSGHKFFMV